MTNKYSLTFILLLATLFSSAQSSYDFIVFDEKPQLFSMHQMDENLLSADRLLNSLVNPEKKKKITAIMIVPEIFLLPISHEEGHRSILTFNGIGAISQPFFNSQGVALVKGVKNADLIRLKKNKNTEYIRLHTAGIESDIAMLNRSRELLFFNEETKEYIYPVWFSRLSSAVEYPLLSLFPSLFPKLNESSDELKNDVVGHDIYGAIKNQYGYQGDFKRYINFKDLNHTERKYLTRIALFSLLNIIDPIWAKTKTNENGTSAGLGCNFLLTPFGNMFESKIYIRNKDRHLKMYWGLQGNINSTDFIGLGGLFAMNDINISNNFFWTSKPIFLSNQTT